MSSANVDTMGIMMTNKNQLKNRYFLERFHSEEVLTNGMTLKL
jgi:hypothetical protein